MKKKLLFLAIGVFAFTASIFAQFNPQPAGTPLTFGGFPVLITGTLNGAAVVNAQVTAQSAISTNSIFTINGMQFAIRPTPQPNAVNGIQNFLFDQFVVLDLNGNGANNVSAASLQGVNPTPVYNGDQVFGTQNGNFTVVAIPFDLGTTVVLGFGLFAALIAAQTRRKQLSMLA